ncbi:uncharacterized protein LOC100838811 [Brachypodium distachyon]|uniref:Bifunctional inhibitor/plant lipid transfer protein/seed storage helical domain-containing protein n=1 Tax=Brachypodium distachyon TaxID=15368 RepID=I1I3E0_BRADI|nr:uncharacterized protein LOC100838811 [Brachypodium distachyon]KQJ96349.1 hypothetical protein BRADI_3g22590v3 [Brachypodium distachyon]|eukprot:XP_003573809.1 uncharacterized protein LOC100838811 [Brachypodium distachyon]
MASLKLVAALAVLAVCAATAAAYGQQPAPYRPPKESCETQSSYFVNCLRLGYGENCCKGVVEDPKCFCMLEAEAEIHCVPGRRFSACSGSGVAKAVKLAEMKLSCMKNLKCKHA